MSYASIKIRVTFKGKSKDQSIKVEENKAFTVGRVDDNTWPLPDQRLSRKHMSFLFDGQEAWLQDEKSTNGVTINGSPVVGKQTLHVGDKIEAGDHILEILEISSPDLTQPKARAIPSPASPLQAKAPPVQNWTKPSPSQPRIQTPPSNSDLHQLDTMELNVASIIDIYKIIPNNWPDFYSKIEFSGDVKRSLMFVAACGVIATLAQMLSHPFFMMGFGLGGSVFAAFGWVIGTCIGCGILSLFKGFLKADGGFNEYLRFATYAAIWMLPLQILMVVTWGLAGIIGLAASLLLLWVFYKVFHPDPIRALILMVGSWVVMFMIGGGMMMGARSFTSPLSANYRTQSAAPQMVGAIISGLMSKAMNSVPHPSTPNPASPSNPDSNTNADAKPNSTQPDTNQDPAAQAAAMLAMASPDSKAAKYINALRIGEYKVGEKFSYKVYETRDNGRVVQGNLDVEILPPASGEQAPQAHFKGDLGGGPKEYTRKLDSNFMLGVVGAAVDEGANTDLARIANSIVVYRDMIKMVGGIGSFAVMAGAKPDEKSEPLPDPQPTKVGGVEGFSLSSLAGDKKTPNDNGEISAIALSPNASLPLLIKTIDKSGKPRLSFELESHQ